MTLTPAPTTTESHNERLTRAIKQAEKDMQRHGWTRLHLDDDSSFLKTKQFKRRYPCSYEELESLL